MKNTSNTPHEAFITALAAHYVTLGMTEDEANASVNLFRALVAGDAVEIQKLLSVYREFPEDGYLVLNVPARTIGHLVGDHGCHYDGAEGELFFRFISVRGVYRLFSNVTGEIQHSISFYVSGAGPTAYQRHKDDRVVGAMDAVSGSDTKARALQHFVRVLDEGIKHHGKSPDFGWLHNVKADSVQSWRELPQWFKEKRSVAAEVAVQKSRAAIVYKLWRMFNYKRLRRFGL